MPEHDSYVVSRLAELTWLPDRMLLGELVFRLEHYKSDAWELGEECFRFFKIQHLVDQYQRFWAGYQGAKPRTIVELGMFDGGSLVFWNEILQPEKIVGVDLAARGDSGYFRGYVASRGLQERVKSYWSTDQRDEAALSRIIQDEFGGRVDLVIDDGSHAYEPTKASFEILYPKLNRSGLYMIEDWAWAHWEECQVPDSEWYTRPAMTKLIFELVEAVGSARPERAPPAIAEVDVQQGFAVIHRGAAELNPDARLVLEEHVFRGPSMQRIYAPPPPSSGGRLRDRLRRLWAS